ncbi:MAG: hypothetical protein RMJ03_04020 [Nitrososphaerota archaeon]|nr:hypothetical protein [Candidatus Bathyarchaeota archaeon]MDW8024033.1 hypothetical protein [Nitrososphaerota archaeon]MDW8040574.1 hypothetical protein [Nitrososphaerota archaeon]
MKVGLVSYEPTFVKGFDPHVYYVKRADGSLSPPAEKMYNDVTCFCDAKAVRNNPGIVAVSRDGPALRRNRKVNLPWDFICPTDEDYREKVLSFIREASSQDIIGIILNLYHFPEEGFCTCERCSRLWRESGLNWVEWRAQAVTNFIKQAKEVVGSKRFAVEIWPDPVLAKERFGIDFNQIANLVDFFHVPLSAHDYTTMYWVDMLTRIFVRILRKPVFIELSAEMLDEDKLNALLKTMAYVSRHEVEGVLLLVHRSADAEKIRDYAVENVELQQWFEKHNFSKMTQVIDGWKNLY